MNKKGIKSKLLIGLIPVIIIALVVLYFLFSIALTKTYSNEKENKLKSETTIISNELDSLMFTQQEIIASLKNSFESARALGLESDNYVSYLAGIAKYYPNYSEVYVWYDATRQLYCGSGWQAPEGFDGTTREWYINAMAKDAVILTEPYVDAVTGGVCVTAGVPFKSTGGTKMGTICCDILISSIQEIIETHPITKNSYTLVVNINDGLLVGNTDKSSAAEAITDSSKYADIAKAINENKEGMINISSDKGKVVYLEKLDYANWYVVTVIPDKELNAFTSKKSSAFIFVGIGLVIIIVVAYILKFVSSSIEKPINKITKQLTSNFNMISDLSNNLMESSNNLSRSTNTQKDAITSTVDNITRTTEQIESFAKDSVQATDASNNTTESARQGSEKLEEMKKTVVGLKESSEQIKNIIKVINDIASQTNILALNASVEAARAGEAGKGFSVVAGEVKNLATKSTEAASNIEDIISQNIVYSEQCQEMTEDAYNVLLGIVENSQSLNDLIVNISSGSVEQTRTLEQVNELMNNIQKQTEANQINVIDKNSGIVSQLNDELTSLNESIEQLKKLKF